MLVVMFLARVEAQLVVSEENETVCGDEECLVISKCPAVLKLVFKVKAGDPAARSQLLRSQCGFEKSLPKVCCPRSVPESSTGRPRIFQNSNFSSLNSDSCGTRTALTFRITLGQDAVGGQFPWLGALMYRDRRGLGVPLCGATLISSQHLITAAHCDSSQGGFRLSSVRLGQVDLSAPVTLPGLEINIEKVVSHQSFTNNPVAIFDIALVKMERPVTFTDMIRPICVYQENEEKEVVEGELIVAGWGRTEKSRSSSVLQFTSLQEVEREECEAMYREAGQAGRLGPLTEGLAVLPSQLCASGEDQTDSCSGDSGGPLMARTDKWYLTGLVSFGTNECDSSLPGVYTRVSFFLDWILETLRNT